MKKCLAACLLLVSSSLMAEYEDVIWTSGTTGTACNGSITVTAAMSVAATNFSSANDGTFIHPEIFGTEFGVAPGYSYVRQSGRALTGSFTFSETVTDPVILFYQLDLNTLTFNLGAGQSMSLLESDFGKTTDSGTGPATLCNGSLVGNVLTGCDMGSTSQFSTGPTPDVSISGINELEGAGTIQFTGRFDSISRNNTGTVKTSDNTTRWAILINCGADIAVSKSDTGTTYTPGQTTTYTIVVSNDGGVDVSGVLVEDAIPTNLTSVTWSCSATTDSSCISGTANATDSGTGSINETIDVASGGTVTYTVTGTWSVTP